MMPLGMAVGKQEIGAVQMPRGNIVSFASLICFPYFRNDFGISFELGFEGKVDIHDQILFRIAKEHSFFGPVSTNFNDMNMISLPKASIFSPEGYGVTVA
ncbi:MAG: hypothetical protein SVT52_03190 [Planctomycetota bacterium]|nr:hypothetical protein [Planctomycetota bacterium]